MSYIGLIFNMVAKTVAEDRSSGSELCNCLSLYMIILKNCCGLVDTYLPMTNGIVLANLGQHVSSPIPLTRVAILQV